MLNSLINVAPSECSDLIANLATVGIGNAVIYQVGGLSWNNAFFEFTKTPLFDAIQSLVFCLIEVKGLLTTGGIGSAIVEAFTTAWDVLNFLVTGVEELAIAQFDMRGRPCV